MIQGFTLIMSDGTRLEPTRENLHAWQKDVLLKGNARVELDGEPWGANETEPVISPNLAEMLRRDLGGTPE